MFHQYLDLSISNRMGLQCKGNKKRPPNKQAILERPGWQTEQTAAEQTVTEEGEQPWANWLRLGGFRFEFNIFQTFKYWKASLVEIPNLKNPESETLFSDGKWSTFTTLQEDSMGSMVFMFPDWILLWLHSLRCENMGKLKQIYMKALQIIAWLSYNVQ